MKALVVGASGLVGSHLMQSGQKRGWQMAGTSIGHKQEDLIALDMRDAPQVEKTVRSERPDVLFLTAFNPNVDECELHPQETRITNVEGNAHVIAAATALAIPLIYYSSDYVFDGSAGPYREADTPHPLSEYGRQKLDIERLLAEKFPASIIIRTTTVYGWEDLGKNFFCQVLHALERDEDRVVPTDQMSTPTFAPDLAEASFLLAERKATGIYHVAGPELMSRFVFAEAIAKAFDLPQDHLKPIATSALKQAAKRPLKGGLLCEKIRQTFPGWQSHSVADSLRILQSTDRR
ncbi:MAG: SDR family oxidoreductase [Candidatus Peribacter sp.]|nr:SDR family oxidoreductase [Candidatus Peribacter sp.]